MRYEFLKNIGVGRIQRSREQLKLNDSIITLVHELNQLDYRIFVSINYKHFMEEGRNGD